MSGVHFYVILGDPPCLLCLHAGNRNKGIYDLCMNKYLLPSFVCISISLLTGDCEMDRCNGHSEEAWSAPRNGQGLHKVLEHLTVKVSTRYSSTPCKSFLQQFSFRSESWVFSMYNGECYDLIRQLANLGMRKLISEDSYHQVVSRFQTNKLHREFTSRYIRTSTYC